MKVYSSLTLAFILRGTGASAVEPESEQVSSLRKAKILQNTESVGRPVKRTLKHDDDQYFDDFFTYHPTMTSSPTRVFDDDYFNKEESCLFNINEDGTITFPPGIPVIGEYVLGCAALTSVTIPKSVTELGDGAFYKSGLKTVIFELPSQVGSIEYEAFYECAALTSVNIPKSVTELEDYAFYNTGLHTVIFESPSQVASISDYAFSGCKALTSVNIPKSVTELGSGAFSRTGLETVKFEKPSQVGSIGKEAFRRCTKLKAIVLPPSLITLGKSVFRDSGLTSIFLPKSITSNGQQSRFAGTCLENLSKVFFQSVVKTKDLIVCECVQVDDLSKCPALNALVPSMNPSTSNNPSKLPSNNPSKLPSMNPSKLPSMNPSELPDQSSICKDVEFANCEGIKIINQWEKFICPNEGTRNGITAKMYVFCPITCRVNCRHLLSMEPSTLPSMDPSKLPSMNPSKLPSMNPSKLPSMNPSKLPSIDPSKLPSMDPSKPPSMLPSKNPTTRVSMLPSKDPSKLYSIEPSLNPIFVPIG